MHSASATDPQDDDDDEAGPLDPTLANVLKEYGYAIHRLERLVNELSIKITRLHATDQAERRRPTHKGPLVYGDRQAFERDLHAAVDKLINDWDNVTLAGVAALMPGKPSPGTVRNRLKDYSLLDGNSIPRTLKRLADEHRRRHGLF